MSDIKPKIVVRYPLNTVGRDFVVGDVHGAFTLLLKAMRIAGFDPAVDRLFCVGDLIDRGPESARVARFLAQPYVHSVRGNHEDMLIELMDGANGPEDLYTFGKTHFMVVRNGLGWWDDTPAEQRFEILQAIRRLPIAIEVETPRGLVGIVHADVPHGMSWQQFTAKLESGDADTLEIALWSRDRVKRGDESGVAGVGRVFVGHTTHLGGVKRYGNIYVLDTGAIAAAMEKHLGTCLTMMNMSHTSQALLSEPVHELPINLLDEPVAHPFGSYAI